jgi:hypothetical protein
MRRVACAFTCIAGPSRRRSVKMFINYDNPREAQRHVEEELRRLREQDKETSSDYLQRLVNLAICHYHQQNYVAAQEYAVYAHKKILEHRRVLGSSLVYFSATTASKCCAALADLYERHVREARELSHQSDALTPGPSRVFNSDRVVQKLRDDAKNYTRMAQRSLMLPRNAYLRGGCHSNPGAEWDDTSNHSASDREWEDRFGPEWKENRKTSAAVHSRQHLKQHSPGPVVR